MRFFFLLFPGQKDEAGPPCPTLQPDSQLSPSLGSLELRRGSLCLVQTPRHRLVQDAGLAIVRGIAVPPEGRWGTLAKPALGVGSPVP